MTTTPTHAQKIEAIVEQLSAEPLAAKCLRLDKELFDTRLLLENSKERERILYVANHLLGEKVQALLAEVSSLRDELADANAMNEDLLASVSEKLQTAQAQVEGRAA